jgi:hypothetical protein
MAKVAPSLEKLKNQIDRAHPRRSQRSDGAFGDKAHQGRVSDHNPWVKIRGVYYVTARDFTHDPDHGFDSCQFAETLRRNKDKRIKYVISNRRIFSGPGSSHAPWIWREYHGSNPHDKHVHISVRPTETGVLGVTPWQTARTIRQSLKKWSKKSWPTLREGDKGYHVKRVQAKLQIQVDGVFGPHTLAAVKNFQKSGTYRAGLHKRKLLADGVVGWRTARALGLVR